MNSIFLTTHTKKRKEGREPCLVSIVPSFYFYDRSVVLPYYSYPVLFLKHSLLRPPFLPCHRELLFIPITVIAMLLPPLPGRPMANVSLQPVMTEPYRSGTPSPVISSLPIVDIGIG